MDKEVGTLIESGNASLMLQNETDIDDKKVIAAIQEYYPQIARNDIATLDEWGDKYRRDRSGGIVGQDKYLAPVKIFDQFRSAAKAARDDDIVSNYLETTEQLAFKKVDIQSFSDDEEENSIWGQIKDHMSFEQKCRQIWRELGIISQCYVGIVWERKDFKVKNVVTETNKKSKKVFKNVLVPKKIVILDPCKILPVGDLEEELVYIASDGEAADFRKFLAGPNTVGDKVFEQWIEGEYQADSDTISLLQEVVGDKYTSLTNNLFRLNKDNVFRITSTKPDYQRFADVRLMSIFNWLDLKHNLQESDRADILGNLNAIIVVRRGDKDRRASAQVLAQTAAQIQQSARLPIMVGDDTLDIEIITRDKNYTLQAERYNAIDSRMTARLYQAMHTGNYCLTPDTEILTKSGWKRYGDIEIGELVYSMNSETGMGEWTELIDINIFNYSGPMLSMENSSHSSLSTPNHRWFVADKYGNYTWKTSEQLNCSSRIPVALESSGFPVEAKYTDELVELAAWYWAEGCRHKYSHNRVEIAQSQYANPEHCERIKIILEKLFGPEGKCADGGLWYQSPDLMKFYISADVTGQLLSLFEDNQVYAQGAQPKIPKLDFIYSLTKEQMQLFVNINIFGDGCTEKNGRSRWHQKDTRSVEIFDICLNLLGIPSRFRLDKSREESGVWTFELLKRDFINPKTAAIESSRRGSTSATHEWVDYKGVVWCPTTKNGTWFARRNGKKFFTGNSVGTATDNSAGLFKVIAASMEARRDDIMDNLQKHVLDVIYDKNDKLQTEPVVKMRRISLDFDPHWAQYIFDLFALDQVSHETVLAEVDLDIKQEVLRKRKEKENYSDVFQPPVKQGAVTGDPSTDGRIRGGNNSGGGSNQESFNNAPKSGTSDEE